LPEVMAEWMEHHRIPAVGHSGTKTSGSEAMGQAFSAQPSVLDYRGTDEAGDDDEIPLSDSPSSGVANRDR